MTRAGRAAIALLTLLLGGCVQDEVREAAVNVVTLQRGTVSDLRARRGQGPFCTYPVAPARMLALLERAAGMARGLGGRPVRAIFVSASRGEVLAKERTAAEADDDGYGAPFRSAMLAIVHPVPGRPDASRVEIHSVQRGPFHRGAISWRRDLPHWIDAALAEDRAAAQPVAPIP